MVSAKKEILDRLRTEMLPLEGLRNPLPGEIINLGLGAINNAFPRGSLPLGVLHEFVQTSAENATASAGFITGLLSGLMKGGGCAVWISKQRTIFPAALTAFGIQPERIIFVTLSKEKDLLWALEESLKCGGLAAVVGELNDLHFTSSRRFQLAMEQSRVTGFILRAQSKILQPNAAVSRWRIKPLPTIAVNDLPGLGFPRWQVDLLKIRNGTPGSWQLEWAENHFRQLPSVVATLTVEHKRKTG